MYLEDFLNQYNDKKVKMFVDMDGVIADYDVGNDSGYDVWIVKNSSDLGGNYAFFNSTVRPVITISKSSLSS